MPLYAYDNDRRLIHAARAVNGRDYRCRECGSVVRVRGGGGRRRHYYHSSRMRQCRSAGKGLVHLAVQHRIMAMIPNDEAEIEQAFPAIRRIADVAWPREQLVFEVQCAPISAEEVAARNRDYAKEGYTVVWVFHMARYGRPLLSPAEGAVQGQTHYYTDIDADGAGAIVDRVATVIDGRRRQRRDVGPVLLGRPVGAEALPTRWMTRRAANGVAFEGDALHGAFVAGDPELAKTLRKWHWRERWAAWRVVERVRKAFVKSLVHPYRCFFRLALERACR